jgi:adenylate kinase family enzyme
MKTFKAYLEENNIVYDKTFIKHLDEWLLKSDQKNAEYLFQNMSKVPSIFRSYSKFLYRGMTIDQDRYDLMIDKGYITTSHRSWSKNESVAKKFADDPLIIRGKSTAKKLKIMIKKKINKKYQILDIHSLCNFIGEDQMIELGLDEMNFDSAFKEEEVLIAKGIKITKKDFKLI